MSEEKFEQEVLRAWASVGIFVGRQGNATSLVNQLLDLTHDLCISSSRFPYAVEEFIESAKLSSLKVDELETILLNVTNNKNSPSCKAKNARTLH